MIAGKRRCQDSRKFFHLFILLCDLESNYRLLVLREFHAWNHRNTKTLSKRDLSACMQDVSTVKGFLG